MRNHFETLVVKNQISLALEGAILVLVRAGATRSRAGLHDQLPTLFGLTALNLQRIRGLSAAPGSGGRFGSFPRMSPPVPPVTI